MPQKGALVVSGLGLVMALGAVAEAAPRPVTVFLERGGRVVDHDGEEVEIPKFGGGDAAWNGIVGCVKTQFAPFQITITDSAPRGGDYITALIGGRASLLGLDDRSTNGVGPYIPNRVQPNAMVHIFSKVGTGERDVQNICAVTVHEVAHALGLDHTHKCGDVMSYYLDRCGPRKFLDVDAACGEFSARACGDGSRSQNSFRMVANLVGLKQDNQPQPEPEPDDDVLDDGSDDSDDQVDPWNGGEEPAQEEPAQDDEVEEEKEAPRRWRGRRGRENAPQGATQQDGTPQGGGNSVQYVEDEHGNRYSVQRVQGRDGRSWVVVRRVR